MISAFLLVIEASVRAAALAACVGAILAAARVRSGAVRHAAWAAVLCAMLLMPLLPRLTPTLDLPVPIPPIADEPQPSLPNPPFAQSVGFGPAQDPLTRAADPITAPTQPQGPVWPAAVLGAYAVGLAFLSARMVAGWRAARQIVCTADALSLAVPGTLVFQSHLIVSPLTAGVFSPRIVLPCAWAGWPDAKLRAVLAHEGAHVRRRDTLVSLAAHLNLCLFWFHPLAWWLERQLAITAEHACDEAAVRATGQHREYAQVLLDFAETVLRTGGRVSLQGAGMDSAGPLEERIARILRADLACGVSRTRKTAVAVCCTMAIILVAACQPSRETQAARAAARAQQWREWELRSAHDFVPNPAGQRLDPATYARARQLWLDGADREGQPATVYLRALAFFREVEPPVAERMLLRAQASDPKAKSLRGMYGGSWSACFGDFYSQAFALYGSPRPLNQWIASALSDEAQASYLAEVSRKLGQSTDETLLLIAGDVLVSMHRPNEASRVPGINAFAVGKASVVRVLKLDPKSTWARQVMNKVHDQELLVSLPDAVWNGPLESRHKAIQALPEGDRFRELSLLAISAGAKGTLAERLRYDATGAKTAWQQATQYAREALALAPKVRNHPDYGTAWFRANMVLGMAAISDGDTKAAAGYLLKAADAPATDELRYPMAGERPWPNLRFPNELTTALLKAGERDAVADFLDRYSRLSVTDHERAQEDAALIRSGKPPVWTGL